MLLEFFIALLLGSLSSAIWLYTAKHNYASQFPSPHDIEDCLKRIHQAINTPQATRRDLLKYIGTIILIFAPLFIPAGLTEDRIIKLLPFVIFFTFSACAMLYSTYKQWKNRSLFFTFRDGTLSYQGRLLVRTQGESLHSYLCRELHTGLDFYRAQRDKHYKKA